MVMKGTILNIFVFECILTLFLTLKLEVIQGENNYNSHKTTGISHIPWNMLLDPNYLSHKVPSSPNRTSFSPSAYEYSSPVSYSHSQQQNSFSPMKDDTNPGVYYVPPTNSQFHPQQDVKYSTPFSTQDHHKPTYSYSIPITSYRPSEKVMFPAHSSHQISKPDSSSYAIASQQQSKNKQHKVKEVDKKKHKKRKPDDYLDLEEEDYLDSYYQDYDYPEPVRSSYRPSRQTSSNKYKGGVDPMGLLPSASDPEGFFSKAKDLLRGGSQHRPNYSPSASQFYQNYSPSKQYEDSTPYGEQAYYGQDNIGYPSKDDSPGYDYEVPYGESHYGGAVPYPSDRRKGSKYGPLAFALGLLPLGLLLASLVPTVVTIPVTTAVAQGRRRKRSIRFVNPVLETISEYGVSALDDSSCLNRIFCQVVRDGQQERSSIIQKLYFKIANIMDEKVAASIGLKELLIAVRRDKCHNFQCSTKNKSNDMKKKS